MAETLYAFPGEYVTHLIASHDGSAEPATVQHPGMTLRDYFAAQALPSVMAQAYSTLREANAEIESVAGVVATFSYEVADAMLAERAKSPAPHRVTGAEG